jgi:hypothetical protein
MTRDRLVWNDKTGTYYRVCDYCGKPLKKWFNYDNQDLIVCCSPRHLLLLKLRSSK